MNVLYVTNIFKTIFLNSNIQVNHLYIQVSDYVLKKILSIQFEHASDYTVHFNFSSHCHFGKD